MRKPPIFCRALKHQIPRADNLKAWWGVVNWVYVAERLDGIRDDQVHL
jgi:superoxide dismutase